MLLSMMNMFFRMPNNIVVFFFFILFHYTILLLGFDFHRKSKFCEQTIKLRSGKHIYGHKMSYLSPSYYIIVSREYTNTNY